jgi:hypothetical protein
MCNEELPFSLFCSNYPSLYRSRQVKAVISAPVMRPKIYWAFFFTAFRAHAGKQQLSFARHLACPRPSLQILINHPNADDKWGARARRCVCVCVCTFAWRVAHAVDHLSLPELHSREAVAKLHTVRSKSKRTSLCESFLGTIFATNKRNIPE